MEDIPYTETEKAIISELERFVGLGEVTLRYNSLKSTTSPNGHYTVFRSLGVLQQNGEYKIKLNLGTINNVMQGTLSEVIQKDILSSFPNLYPKFHVRYGEEIISKAKYPSIVSKYNGGMEIKNTNHTTT